MNRYLRVVNSSFVFKLNSQTITFKIPCLPSDPWFPIIITRSEVTRLVKCWIKSERSARFYFNNFFAMKMDRNLHTMLISFFDYTAKSSENFAIVNFVKITYNDAKMVPKRGKEK